jgi:hypothetical protein
MTKAELKDQVGKFGMIRAGDVGYRKTMHGNIKEMDARGTLSIMMVIASFTRPIR